ncbi:MAG TPA: two-component system response regulator, partial [Armatimonadota bacterium]|nr:two-component system response regulator [Armatimonadota bacterium]
MAKRILVVDDERHIVRLVQVNLERAGYEVVTAFDGKEA